MGGKSPDPDRTRHTPRSPSVPRFSLQGLSFILHIVIADLCNERPITRLHRVWLMIITCHQVPRTNGNLRQHLPRQPVIFRLSNPDPLFSRPKLLPDVKQSAIRQLYRPMRTVHPCRNARRPGDTAIRGSQRPLTQLLFPLLRRQPITLRLPPTHFLRLPVRHLLR